MLDRTKEARAQVNAAHRLLPATGHEYLHAQLLHALALVHIRTGHHREAISVTHQLLDQLRRITPVPLLETFAYWHLADAWAALGDVEQASRNYQLARKTAETHGLRENLAGVLADWADLLAARGAIDEAVDKWLQAIEQFAAFRDARADVLRERVAAAHRRSASVETSRHETASRPDRTGS
jgi:tetratricopeptide (TPR) repeat protein